MSSTRIQKLLVVRDEFVAARSALLYAVTTWPDINYVKSLQGASGALAARGSTFTHFRAAQDNLEATYIIRLFSQFEDELKQWLIEQNRRVPFSAESLLNRVALVDHVANDVRDGAHAIRIYRNAIVHAPSAIKIQTPFSSASAALNRFLSWLPEPP